MKKIGYFFFCFLPLAASIGLQFLIPLPVMGFSALQVFFFNIASGRKSGLYDLLTSLGELWSSQAFTYQVSILFAIAGIAVFGIWYHAQFRGNLGLSANALRSPAALAGILCMVPALQMVSTFLAGASASVFPDWMEYYEELMESAGFGSEPTLPLILYAVFLGPIEEELTFRGVILSSARRAMPFWAANLFQALLFGIFHMNMIQGIYAFFIGLCLGYVCERGGSICLSMLLHILFNAWGTFQPANSPLLESVSLSVLFFIGSILIGIFGFILFRKNTARKPGRA